MTLEFEIDKSVRYGKVLGTARGRAAGWPALPARVANRANLGSGQPKILEKDDRNPA